MKPSAHPILRHGSRARRVVAATIVGLLLVLTAIPASGAAHSDIILSHTNGVLQVDATIHTADVRENDASGTGTVWATDNPGFAGSRFRFNDELLFDVTGPLRRWADGRWSTNNVGPEIMQFIEPGPFGDPLNSVTISGTTTLAPGYRIAQVGTRGTLHTHFVFLLRTTNGIAPDVGAYSFPLTLCSPQYASAPPVHLVFNNGLEETIFATAVDQLRAAQKMRLTLARGPNGALALSLFTVESRTNQLLTATTPNGPWNQHGPAFVGDGGIHPISVDTNSTQMFFRLIGP